ncbi:MAG: J domain-containing protein [Chloroflexi bacterium]|nr:J domain-containing protein [Chloroflexota bacterium]
MEYQDYYKILGVSRQATDKEIRDAFRRLARKYHPDVNPGNKAAEEQFKKINEAYTVLSDPEKHRKYDMLGANFEQFSRSTGRTATSPTGSRRSNVPFDRGDLGGFRTSTSGGLGDFSDFFDMLFNDGSKRRTTTPQATATDQQLEVTLTEAFTGVKRPFEVTIAQPCALCNGTGRYRGSVCFTCSGTGQMKQTRRVEVQVPVGVADGTRLQVRTDAASTPLTFVMSVLPDPNFERKGDDLYVDVPVPLTTAVLGGEVPVANPAGKRFLIKIPAESENGKRIVLRGLGMPKASGSGFGDLYARIQVELPHHLTAREREIFEELRRLRSAAGTR